MTDKPKRYIKIKKDGKTMILDTHTETTINIEDADGWLNWEWKERQYERKRYEEETRRHEETRKELYKERESSLLRRAAG